MSQQENNQQNSNGNDWPSSSQGDEWISSAQQPQSNNDGGFLTSTPNEPYSQQSNSTFRCYEEHWSQFNSQEDSFWGRSSQENTQTAGSNLAADQNDSLSSGNRTNYTDYWMPTSNYQSQEHASFSQSSYHTCFDQTSQYSQSDAYGSSHNNWNNLPDSQSTSAGFTNSDDTLEDLIKQNNAYEEERNN